MKRKTQTDQTPDNPSTEEGIYGTFPGSVEERREAIYRAIAREDPSQGFESFFMFDDFVVVGSESQFFKYPYKMVEGEVELGAPEEVAPTFASKPRGRGRPPKVTGPRSSSYENVQNLDSSATEETLDIADGITVLEQVDDSGWVWEIVVIKAGVSENGVEYSPQLLKESVAKYEGAQVYIDHPTEPELRARRGNRSLEELAGYLKDVRYESDSLIANFHINKTGKLEWLRDLMKTAVEENKALFGFSHNITYAEGKAEQKVVNGRRITSLKEILAVTSVDVVTRPSAGGEVLRMVAHIETESESMFKNLEELKASKPDVYAGLMPLRESNWDAFAAVAATLVEDIGEKPAATQTPVQTTEETKPAPVQAAPVQPAQPDVSGMLTQMQESMNQMKLAACQSVFESRVAALKGTKMPIPMIESIETRFGGKLFEVTELDGAIAESKKLWAALENQQGSGQVRIPAHSSRITLDSKEQIYAGIVGGLSKTGTKVSVREATGNEEADDTFKVPAFKSVKEAYCLWTGKHPFDVTGQEVFLRLSDKKVTGRSYDSHIHENQILEELDSASWGEIWTNAMHKRMFRDYIERSENAVWKRVVSEIGSVNDFRAHRISRLGGYGTLSQVGENQQYPDLTSPGDEEVTFSVVKYGGLEHVTMEAFVNDDMGALSKIPTRLARSANETVFRKVMDLIRLGHSATIYDGVELFHNDHGNAGTTALTHASLSVARAAMRDQTAYGDTSMFLDLTPKILLIPSELEDTAFRITRSSVYGAGGTVSGENATTANIHQSGVEPIVINYWTDANNWVAMADPSEYDTIGVYFLNGRQEPELFVADDPTVGDNLNYDRITYKVRHIFDEVVLDYRAFFGAAVT